MIRRTYIVSHTTMRKTFLAVALSFVSALPAMAQIGSPLDASLYIGPFGPTAVSGTPALAQTFTRAAGQNYLQSFSFFLGDNSDSGTGNQLQFQAAVFTMSGTSLGSQLFISSVRSGSANYSGFDMYSFLTPNLFLNPSVSTFALVLRSVSSVGGALNVVGQGGTDYAGGSFFVVNSDNSLSPAIDGTTDAAFSATLTSSVVGVVPEPATLLLTGVGLLLVGVVGRRRSARVAASSL